VLAVFCDHFAQRHAVGPLAGFLFRRVDSETHAPQQFASMEASLLDCENALAADRYPADFVVDSPLRDESARAGGIDADTEAPIFATPDERLTPFGNPGSVHDRLGQLRHGKHLHA
jgi:hypothetical protein